MLRTEDNFYWWFVANSGSLSTSSLLDFTPGYIFLARVLSAICHNYQSLCTIRYWMQQMNTCKTSQQVYCDWLKLTHGNVSEELKLEEARLLSVKESNPIWASSTSHSVPWDGGWLAKPEQKQDINSRVSNVRVCQFKWQFKCRCSCPVQFS